MQKWEYLTLARERKNRHAKWSQNTIELPNLGNEGWELVSVIYRTDINMGSTYHEEEVWIFKRLKEV